MNLNKTSSTGGRSSRKKRDRSSSSSDSSSSDNDKKVLKHKSKKTKLLVKQKERNTSKHKYKKRKSRSSSSDSTSEDSSTSSSDSSSSSSSEERKKRKRKILKKSLKVKAKKTSKRVVEKEMSDEGPSNDIPIDLMGQRNVMAPMTKEEWDKRQSVVKRQYDPTTGRDRLIKGDGEVIEEIVSRDRHKQINQQATKGDGEFFQNQLKKK
ncbi:ADP-ribosylation factor-like protein 6-interacting protein 4 isoform X2 [Harmonia axyridis]|uniref:ADP-ribosylation factor-like protein 6-interacting protein 4 isoform X2 n=1 Tax=Harmonia axyridis TaxID=115357 RepID=UPI001E274FDC|nr:ADP-ribosylation factor-like protein 6-interacting protein 4 isoform X2 [Harmonia axyridis]